MMTKYLLSLIMMASLLMLSSCNEAPTKAKKGAACLTDESFNNKSRTCVKTRFLPTPTLRFASFVEGATANVTLSYTDINNDFAESCDIEDSSIDLSYFTSSAIACSCVGGVCRANLGLKANVPTGHDNVITQFRYNVTDKDGTSSNQLVQVTLIPVNGLPNIVGATSSVLYNIDQNLAYSATGSFLAANVQNVASKFEDEDGDDLTFYLTQQPNTNLGYLCDFGLNDNHNCSLNSTNDWDKVFFHPKKGQTGSTSFKFVACDGPYPASCSGEFTFTVTIDEIDNLSLVSSVITSNDHLPFDFQIQNTLSDAGPELAIAHLPSVGTLADNVTLPLNNHLTAPNVLESKNFILNYNPASTLANQTGTKASLVKGGLTFTSTFASALANNIKISLFEENPNLPLTSRTFDKDFAYVTVANTGTSVSPGWDIIIHQSDNAVLDESDIEELIENDWYASKLLTVDRTSDNIVNPFVATNLSGGVNGYSYFVYCLDSNASNDAATCNTSYPRAIVTFDITKGNQAPKICEYSSFSQAPECGFDGCIGDSSPLNRITPQKAGIFFYDTSSHTCFESNGTTAGSWESNSLSTIANKKVNEYDIITIRTRIDEDEIGAASQDAETFTITGVTSSNVALFPKDNIGFTYGPIAEFFPAVLPSPTFGSATLSDDKEDFTIRLRPIAGRSGISTITITFKDSTDHVTTISFTAEVVAASANFSSWKNIESVGAKTVKTGVVLDCPSSIAKCGGGQACRGATDPTLGVIPDSVGAVYENTSADKCYYATGTTAASWREYIPYLNEVEDREHLCPYSRTKCSGFECKGTSSPLNRVIPDAKNAIYFDSSNDKCYYAVTGSNSASWTEFETYCGITESDYHSSEEVESSCESTYGASCIGAGEPSTVPNKIDELYFDMSNGICYRSFDTTSANDWVMMTAPANVTIEANAFSFPASVTRSAVTYNVYRRLAEEEYDYEFPINKVEVKEDSTTSTITFVDNGINSYQPPSPNTVYYYEIVPVIGGIRARSNTQSHNPRILAAPDNQALVHRWVVNQANCKKLGLNGDPNDDYSCTYVGPGDNDGKIKQDYDLLVDRFEVGCAYTRECNTEDGSCVGVQDPNLAPLVSANGNPSAVYYDRKHGKCYKRDIAIANSWDEITDGVLPDKADEFNYAYLPPLVSQTQDGAQFFCQEQESFGLIGINSTSQPLTRDLPNRREQVAYSMWKNDETGTNEVTITTYEAGAGLDLVGETAQSGVCNSSNASGIDDFDNDPNVPASSNFFTLPNTANSGVKSIVTGSEQTRFCQSRFGVQDAVGNVSEWVSDRVRCNDFISCTALHVLNDAEVTPAIDLLDSQSSLVVDFGAEATYTQFQLFPVGGLPSLKGAHTLANAGLCPQEATPLDGQTRYFGVCSNVEDSWTIKDNLYNLDKFFAPTGLLLHKDYVTANPTSLIKSSSLVSTANTRNDIFAPNRPIIFSESSGCGGMVTGGSYLNGTGAGIYYLEFVPCSENPGMAGDAGYFQHSDFVIKAKNSGVSDMSFELYSDVTDVTEIDVDLATKDVRVNIANLGDENADGVTDYEDVAELVNTTPSAFNMMEVFPIVNGSSLYSTGSLVDFTPVTLNNKRRDIGFRCVTRIQDSDYQE
jgi:hypothetical protein